MQLSREAQIKGAARREGRREEQDRILKLLEDTPGGRFIERAKLARLIRKETP